jgi:hypothetical protein
MAILGRRDFLFALAGTTVAWPRAAHAEQPAMPVPSTTPLSLPNMPYAIKCSALGSCVGMSMKRKRFCWIEPLLSVAIFAVLGSLPNHCRAEEQSRVPILIRGVQEPAEMQVEPFPITKYDLTAPERMLGEVLQNSNGSKPATLLPALDRILAQHPDFSDGYMMRI